MKQIVKAQKQFEIGNLKTPLIHWKGEGWYEFAIEFMKGFQRMLFYGTHRLTIVKPVLRIRQLIADGYEVYTDTDEYVGLRRGIEYIVIQRYVVLRNGGPCGI